MNLSTMLRARAAEGRPVTCVLIGAGQFGTMFMAQARTTVGLHLVEILDDEGGFCVWGKQQPAEVSLARGLLPLGLAHDVRLEVREEERRLPA